MSSQRDIYDPSQFTNDERGFAAMKNVSLFVLTAALCWILPAASFAANDCTTDADGGDGFICETYQEPCAVAPCMDGEECPDTCDSEEVSECRPAPPESCTSAADC